MTIKSTEFIRAPAIKRAGRILALTQGDRSHFALRSALGDDNPEKSKPDDVDGFITNRGRFVTRKEAVPIAIEAGQLNAVWATVTRDLLSSDFPDW